MIKTVTEFGIALVEKQHRFFTNGDVDNCEHVPAIKRIADTAYAYLKRKGVSSDEAKKVKNKLIDHGRDLFLEVWMKTEEDEEQLTQEDREEGENTFYELLKESGR